MTIVIALLLSQLDVRAKGFELTARTEQNSLPNGVVVRFRWVQEVYSISRGDLELTRVPVEVAGDLAQVRRGYGESTLVAARPGVYRVDALCEFEDQVDLKARELVSKGPAIRMSQTVVVGSCKEWLDALKDSHRQIQRWMEEADRILSAGVTELTRDQVERLHDQIEKARKSVVLTGSVEVLQALTRDMISGLCYPKLNQAVVVRKGQSRTPLKDDEPDRNGSAEGEFGVPAPDQKGPTDMERNVRAVESYKKTLARLKEPLRREFQVILLWRATLKVDTDVAPLAEVEKRMSETDPAFTYASIRTGMEKLAKEPEAVYAAWQETLQSLLKAAP